MNSGASLFNFLFKLIKRMLTIRWRTAVLTAVRGTESRRDVDVGIRRSLVPIEESEEVVELEHLHPS